MSAVTSRPFVSLEDFLQLDPEPGTWLEWSAGLVYAMSGGSPEHARLTAKITAILDRALGTECTVFGSSADIWVEAAEFYGQADVSVVCGALRTFTVKKKNQVLGEAIVNPEVIVEVLSPSTETRDRGEKFAAYKQIPSLKEYVLISQNERRVEVRRRGEQGWSVDNAGPEQLVRIHGHEVAVADIYG